MEHPQASRRGYWSLIATQFQGAFSDNALKNLIFYLALGAGMAEGRLVMVVGLLFSAPFLLFSMYGGYLADRWSKRTITIATKLLELAVALLAAAGLIEGSLALLFAALFLISTQAALFSPSKYGLLPELLPESLLSWGNGVLEMSTFVAIIVGTASGAWLADASRGRPAAIGGFLLVCSVLGLGSSLGICRVQAANPARKPRLNFLAEVIEQIRAVYPDRVLWLAIVGNTWFWFYAALVNFNIPLFANDVLGAGHTQAALLVAVQAVGIGLGSLAAGYLSAGKIELGLIPFGCFGVLGAGTVLGAARLGYAGVMADLVVLGFFAGFIAVPINAIMQHRPRAAQRGTVLALQSFLSFCGIAAASGVYTLLRHGLDTRATFLALAGITLLGTVWALYLLPVAFLRFVLWIGAHSLYRMRVTGLEHLPRRGGALLVANHISWVDALLLSAASTRRIRFLAYRDLFDRPVAGRLLRLAQAIPIAARQNLREMAESLRAAAEAIRGGSLVCIFGEGQITRTGNLLPFRRGMERIMRAAGADGEADAPIIPVCMEGLWGSVFSFKGRRFLWKLPQRWPYPVHIQFGAPLAANASAAAVREAVQKLQSQAWEERARQLPRLERSWRQQARRHPWRTAMHDQRSGAVRSGAALVKTVFLARRLRRHWAGQATVGILLPPSVGAALANFAAQLAGKQTVNLNYTLPEALLASCARQAGLKTVITSRAFLQQRPMAVPGAMLCLEDLAAAPRLGEKLAAAAAAWLLPAARLEAWVGREQARGRGNEGVATILFSSGSTGDPKGVMLTHRNIAANIEQVTQVFDLERSDVFLGSLPLFHSFGYTMTLWLPALRGLEVVYHPDPREAKTIGKLVERRRVTFVLGVPKLLQLYLAQCASEQFGSVRRVLVGAEKLPERVAEAFERHFGLRPIEGYGTTECAPVIAVNTVDVRAAGVHQVGAKRGSVGHPLPGMAIRILSPETGEAVAPGASGVLWVKGPNVMQGFLGRAQATAAVLQEGWYNTGDIVTEDEDGFLAIAGRLSRFAKCGGEMVPLDLLEERLRGLIEGGGEGLAVAAVASDEGERLVVLHCLAEDQIEALLRGLTASDLPNGWKPKPQHFFRVEALPVLGTGKADLRAIAALAQQAFANGARARASDAG